MAEHHSLRIARAARRVLDESRVGGAARREPATERRSALLSERLHRGHIHQARNVRPHDPSDALDLIEADQESDLGVAQDRDLPPNVLFNLVGPRRRIDGDGDPSRQHDSEERVKEVGAGRQHDRHRLIALEAPGDEPCRYGRGRLEQLAVGDVLARVAFEQVDLRSIGLDLSVMAEDLRPISGRLGRRRCLARGLLDAVARLHGPGSGCTTVPKRLDPFGGRFGPLRDLVRQPRVESRLAS